MNAQGAWQSCWHIGSPQAMAPHHCGYHAVNIFSWIFQERMWQSQADMAKKEADKSIVQMNGHLTCS